MKKKKLFINNFIKFHKKKLIIILNYRNINSKYYHLKIIILIIKYSNIFILKQYFFELFPI